MKKNGRYSRNISTSSNITISSSKPKPTNFHQQSLEDALELRNVTSIENIKEYTHFEKGGVLRGVKVAKKIDRKLSIGDVDPNDFDFSGMKDLDDEVFEEDDQNIPLDFVPSKFQATNVDKLSARRLSREKNWQAFDHSGTVAQKI